MAVAVVALYAICWRLLGYRAIVQAKTPTALDHGILIRQTIVRCRVLFFFCFAFPSTESQTRERR